MSTPSLKNNQRIRLDSYASLMTRRHTARLLIAGQWTTKTGAQGKPALTDRHVIRPFYFQRHLSSYEISSSSSIFVDPVLDFSPKPVLVSLVVFGRLKVERIVKVAQIEEERR